MPIGSKSIDIFKTVVPKIKKLFSVPQFVKNRWIIGLGGNHLHIYFFLSTFINTINLPVIPV